VVDAFSAVVHKFGTNLHDSLNLHCEEKRAEQDAHQDSFGEVVSDDDHNHGREHHEVLERRPVKVRIETMVMTSSTITRAIAPVAAEIIPGRPPENAITTAIQNNA